MGGEGLTHRPPETLKKFFQGIILGFTLVLPGISGGTAFLILGIYEQVLADLSSLRLKPHLLLFLGAATGLTSWVFFFHRLTNAYPPLVFSFLLGALWASAPLVLRYNQPSVKGFSIIKTVYLCGGMIIGWFLAVEPLANLALKTSHSFFLIFLGGAIASATMLIPGISGSAVLLIMGMYEDILHFLRYIELIPLAFFSAGCVCGLLGLSKVLLYLFKRYQVFFSYFTAGLILGSGRTLFPPAINFAVVLSAVCGAALVSMWGGKDRQSTPEKTDEQTNSASKVG